MKTLLTGKAFALILLAGLLGAGTGPARAFSTAGYFPLADGIPSLGWVVRNPKQ